ncbi:TetR/AcrR family transcriptional regulator [Candidatus Protofrankia californiensis]|uniref:TetR/AcrR family transcriptional regulator n=1 Tax=Candidatus Protofrankia californiensis TaxID=1839754 RepID=UPI00104161A5|nr:TetR/AcrR family transcriptional regulator [Candidatus Protofrankia californiensis]
MTAGTEQRRWAGKREAILEAGFALFAEVGYTAATIDEVARRAAVSKPTIYSLVGNKEGLLRAVLQLNNDQGMSELAEAFRALPDLATDAYEDLCAVGRVWAERFCRDRSLVVRRLIFAEMTRFPDLHNTYRVTANTEFVELLSARLRRLADRELLRVADPSLAATQFLALLRDQIWTVTSLGTKPIEAVEIRSVVEQSAHLIADAYRP